jgi:hypothetical protein
MVRHYCLPVYRSASSLDERVRQRRSQFHSPVIAGRVGFSKKF